MTWVNLPGGLYVKPESTDSLLVIFPYNGVQYQLTRRFTTGADTQLIGYYTDPNTAMAAAAANAQ